MNDTRSAPRNARITAVSALAGVSLVAAIASIAPAAAAQRAGVLDCDVSGGIGLVIASSKQVRCVFTSGGRREVYLGTINRYGLDIGATAAGKLLWAVVSEQRRPPSGALAGRYVGGSAEVTAGLGLGANALLGGSASQVALQPLSVQGQAGLALAAGVAELTLVPGR